MPVAGTLGIADVAVFVVMLAIVAMLWILLQARAPIGSVPIVGGPGVNLIDGMRNTITVWANNIESFLTWQQSQATATWQSFITNVMTPALNLNDAALAAMATTLHSLIQQAVGAVQVGLVDLRGLVTGTIYPAVIALQARIAAEETFARLVLMAGITATAHQLAVAEQQLAETQGRVLHVEQQLAQGLAAIAVLVSYLPVIQGLAGFEAGTLGGIGAVQQDLAQQRGRIQVTEQDLAKLLTLSGITALGAVAIENLIRVARDPCSACRGTNLLELEARLASVEFFGET